MMVGLFRCLQTSLNSILYYKLHTLLYNHKTMPILTLTKPLVLAPADATTEVFSFFLLLLPLEIPGQWMPSQPSLSLQSYRSSTDFLSWSVKLKLTVLMPILTDRYAHKVIRIALYRKICMYFNSCWSVCKILSENVFLTISSLLLFNKEVLKRCCCYFHCYTWSHQSSLNSVH